MPLITLKTSAVVPAAQKAELATALSKIVVEATGKPEAYTMALIEAAEGCFGGKPGAIAFVEVRGIGGLGKPVNARIQAAVAELLKARLGIPPERIYGNYIEVPATAWGWKDSLFG